MDGDKLRHEYMKALEQYIKQGNNELQNTDSNAEDKKTHSPKVEVQAQKYAISQTMLHYMSENPEMEPVTIWKQLYAIHVGAKSGVSNPIIIANVISADQSWKKSSGHAFESMVSSLLNNSLAGTGLKVVLQKDLHAMINRHELHNLARDVTWIQRQIKANVFDLYLVANYEDGFYCIGCIQCKTSIRDRVTRDREPSIAAMNEFFWSSIIVLDGDFLKNEKFVHMVNGGGVEFEQNGWHGMYVISKVNYVGRIYPFGLFKEHALVVAERWRKNRQLIRTGWDVTNPDE